MQKKVIIVGGGAAGLTCAVRLKQINPGAAVTILEQNDRVGKKILKTGNGRCNLTNLDMRPEYYNHPDFMEKCLKRCSAREVIAFFNGIGLLTRTDSEGRVYPYSETAASVLDVLRRELEKNNIEVVCGAAVREITKKDTFIVKYDGGEAEGDYLVLACGSQAQAETNGYDLAVRFGHAIIPVRPGLVPLRTAESLRSVSGLRVKCQAEVVRGTDTVHRESGEILFKDEGISGILTLNLSRHAAPGNAVVIDFLAGTDRKTIAKLIESRPEPEALTGILPKMLARAVTQNLDGFSAAKVLAALENFRLTVSGTYGFGQAQIAMGGVDITGINDDFSSRLVPGLYMVGELLDIDGACGGYNLHFAWASALIAAESLGFEKK
ncbi:MAG TPA: aminoacetone oxidase family FAD-binding enzyme [Acholeplasmataceae bacterium]|nr:aminoacetone oxidase family FAD-binding enzyme [Acholeplasmataceae bacterium]